jgi:hypothetical protein
MSGATDAISALFEVALRLGNEMRKQPMRALNPPQKALNWHQKASSDAPVARWPKNQPIFTTPAQVSRFILGFRFCVHRTRLDPPQKALVALCAIWWIWAQCCRSRSAQTWADGLNSDRHKDRGSRSPSFVLRL